MQFAFSSNGVLFLVSEGEDGLPHRASYMPGAELPGDIPADLLIAIEAAPQWAQYWATPEAVAAWKAENDPGYQPEDMRLDLKRYADDRFTSLITAGFVYQGKHIRLDDLRGRPDVTGMGAIAYMAVTGATAWPANYQLGWITVENDRLPLPTPQAGLALALAAGTAYSSLAQATRDAKDGIESGEVVTTLQINAMQDAVWPSA